MESTSQSWNGSWDLASPQCRQRCQRDVMRAHGATDSSWRCTSIKGSVARQILKLAEPAYPVDYAAACTSELGCYVDSSGKVQLSANGIKAQLQLCQVASSSRWPCSNCLYSISFRWPLALSWQPASSQAKQRLHASRPRRRAFELLATRRFRRSRHARSRQSVLAGVTNTYMSRSGVT